MGRLCSTTFDRPLASEMWGGWMAGAGGRLHGAGLAKVRVASNATRRGRCATNLPKVRAFKVLSRRRSGQEPLGAELESPLESMANQTRVSHRVPRPSRPEVSWTPRTAGEYGHACSHLHTLTSEAGRWARMLVLQNQTDTYIPKSKLESSQSSASNELWSSSERGLHPQRFWIVNLRRPWAVSVTLHRQI